MIERWIVEEFNDAYEDWYTWGQLGFENRFWSFHNARKAYEEHKKTFHYSPCHYRFCKITIQPETVISKEVHSQGKDPAGNQSKPINNLADAQALVNERNEVNNLEKPVRSEVMKFT